MPLLKNTNQPYFPDPNSPASRTCNGEYCYPINLADDIYQQWYQTPCGANEIADPEFSSVTYGAEMVTNGDFATDLTGWSVLGGWVWDTGQAEGPVSTFANYIMQNPGFTGSPATYRLELDISGLSPGDYLQINVGGEVYETDQNGAYDEIVLSGSSPELIFIAGPDNLGNVLIDNVSLKAATFADWDTNGNWTLDPVNGTACADGTGTGLLEEAVADYIEANEYYYLSFVVSNYSEGGVTPNVANIAGTQVTSNGLKEFYLTPTATGVVSFLPTADFVGCISEVNLQQLRNDYLFEIINSDGDRYDFSHLIEYYEDKVTLTQNIFNLLELDYGCYTMEVIDSCTIQGDNLIADSTFAQGWTEWTRNNGASQFDVSTNAMEFIFEPLEGADLLSNGDFSGGATGWTVPAGWAIGGGQATHTPGNTGSLSATVTIGTPAVAPASLISWIQFTISGRTAGSVTATLSNATSFSYNTNDVITTRLIPTIGGGPVTFSINPTTDFDGVIDDISVHQTANIWSDFPIVFNAVNTDIVAGNYAMTFDITAINGTTAGTIGVAGTVLNQTQSFVYETTVATHNVSITNYVPGNQRAQMVARFRVGNNWYPGSITIDNVELVRVEPFEATYTSECLNYQSEHDNTYLVTGTCDQESFGFEFTNTGFKLQMRMEARGLNPVYNKTKNIAQFGTGNAAMKYAEATKYWQLHTGFMSESAHDCLSTIIDCDHFTLGTSDTDGIAYVAEAEDYSPQWIQDGSYSLAPVVVTLRLEENGMKFNRHI